MLFWILLVVAVAAAVAMFEFWPNKPGRADNGVSHIDGMDQINRSVSRPRVPRPRDADSDVPASRLGSRQRR